MCIAVMCMFASMCCAFTENFRNVLSSTTVCQAVPFDFDCTFVKQYFGSDKKHLLDYYEFCQLLQVYV